MVGYVGVLYYNRGTRRREWRVADPDREQCQQRLARFVGLAQWIGCRIHSTVFGRGMIWGGQIHWEEALL